MAAELPGRLLLDTHIFIWWKQDHRSLKAKARQAIAQADVVYVSAASAWEAAIKTALGKLELPGSFAEGVAESEFTELPVLFSHIEELVHLPTHHSDPFDRLLIAQSRCEGLTLVTHDAAFRSYKLPLLLT